MTEQEVMRLLRAVHELDIKEREEGIAKERANCLPLHRFRTALLHEDWTEAEMEHISKCAYCRKLKEKVQQALWHPTPLQLFMHILQMLTDDEATDVRYHLEEDKCIHCIRLSQSPILHKFAEVVRIGQRTVKQIEAALSAAVVAFARLPAQAGAFAEGTRLPFHLWAKSPDGSLVVTVRETDEGKLVAYVETPNRELLGRKVHVELIGERETLTAEVAFDFQHERGCVGQHSFGVFAEIAPRLGSDCQVIAVLSE